MCYKQFFVFTETPEITGRMIKYSLKIEYRVHRTSVPKVFDVLNSASFNE